MVGALIAGDGAVAAIYEVAAGNALLSGDAAAPADLSLGGDIGALSGLAVIFGIVMARSAWRQS